MGIMARMGKKQNACRVLVKISKGKNHLEFLGVDGNITLVL